VQGKRAKIGSVVLTNDRIVFVKDAGGAGGGGLIESSYRRRWRCWRRRRSALT
jgi:hypothetical protein